MSNVYSPLLTELIQALQCLPGVGRKSAQAGFGAVLEPDTIQPSADAD